MNLVPAAMQPALKAWVSLIGVIVSALTASISDAPKWLAVVGAVVASVGAYLVPNTDPTEQEPASDGTPSVTTLPEKKDPAGS